MSNSPFAKLLRSKTVLDRETQERLADLLEPYIWLDPDNNLVVFKDAASSLTSLQRVLVFMLAHKIKNLVKEEMSPAVTASEVEIGTGLPGGTVRPKLTELAKKKLLVRSGRAYEMASNFMFPEIQAMLRPR